MLLNCHYRSPVLRRNTEITVILPTPEEEGGQIPQNCKVLYLLHGLHGDASSWLRFSNIERYAQEAGIAVVMPSVLNSFYQDMVHGERFFTYMTQELPQFICGLFPVSQKREDTYIAGLSMGGYGAWFLALSRPELYSAAASLSGAVDIGFRVTPPLASGKGPMPFFVEDCFGDITQVAHSHRDIIALYEKAADPAALPRLYQSCGTEDYHYTMNRLTNEKLTSLGARITWREEAGKEHEWDFWDSELRYLLEHWLTEAD